MKLAKQSIVISMIIICLLMFISTPTFAAESLTTEQQAYLQRYVLTYVTEGNKKDLFEYSTSHNILLSYQNGSGNRKDTILLCIILCNNVASSSRSRSYKI